VNSISFRLSHVLSLLQFCFFLLLFMTKCHVNEDLSVLVSVLENIILVFA